MPLWGCNVHYASEKQTYGGGKIKRQIWGLLWLWGSRTGPLSGQQDSVQDWWRCRSCHHRIMWRRGGVMNRRALSRELQWHLEKLGLWLAGDRLVFWPRVCADNQLSSVWTHTVYCLCDCRISRHVTLIIVVPAAGLFTAPVTLSDRPVTVDVRVASYMKCWCHRTRGQPSCEHLLKTTLSALLGHDGWRAEQSQLYQNTPCRADQGNLNPSGSFHQQGSYTIV